MTEPGGFREVMVVRCAGMRGNAHVVVDSLACNCGPIEGGVGVHFSGQGGGFVMNSDDVLALADRIRAHRAALLSSHP